jgi:hypothetical protein
VVDRVFLPARRRHVLECRRQIFVAHEDDPAASGGDVDVEREVSVGHVVVEQVRTAGLRDRVGQVRRPVFRGGQVLGTRSRPVPGEGRPEHPVALGEGVDAWADRSDGPREVVARDHRHDRRVV